MMNGNALDPSHAISRACREELRPVIFRQTIVAQRSEAPLQRADNGGDLPALGSDDRAGPMQYAQPGGDRRVPFIARPGHRLRLMAASPERVRR